MPHNESKVVDTSGGALTEEHSNDIELAPGETHPDAVGDTVDTPLEEEAGKEKEGEVGPAYVPNRKFKVLDQEKEFDEWVTPALNKETEAKFRELYEKAYGLDHVKPKLAEERQARTQIEGQLRGVTHEVQEILKHRDAGDLGTFFQKVNLPVAKVAQWLLAEAERQDRLKDLPPEMKQVYTDYGTLKQQNEELARKVESLHSGSVDTAVHARSAELQSVTSRPNIQPLIQGFDARLGKPGAFQDLVIRHGKAEFDASGGQRDLSAEEAVNEVLTILGLQTQAASPAATPNESANARSAAPPTPKVVTPTKPTVIPNVGSSNASPAMKKPRNLEELREMAKKASAG